MKSCSAPLTGNTIGLYFKAGHIVPRNTVAFCAHTPASGPHGGVSSSLVDLIGDHLQVLEGCLVFSLGLGQFSLTLVYVLLQVLQEEEEILMVFLEMFQF